MERFKACVQYGDWTGTVAADNENPLNGLQKLLTERKLIHDGEYLIATSLWIGENHGETLGSVYVFAYLFTGKATAENVKFALENLQGAVPIRKISIEMTITEYILLFKRFNVMLTVKGLRIEGAEYIEAH